MDDPWKYDPFHVISNMKHAVGLQSYVHHLDATRERLANKDSWTEVQQLLQHHILDMPKKESSPMNLMKDILQIIQVINIEDDTVKEVDSVIETPRQRKNPEKASK
jgi:hypothetical protein